MLQLRPASHRAFSAMTGLWETPKKTKYKEQLTAEKNDTRGDQEENTSAPIPVGPLGRTRGPREFWMSAIAEGGPNPSTYQQPDKPYVRIARMKKSARHCKRAATSLRKSHRGLQTEDRRKGRAPARSTRRVR
eukprot:2250032-Rhodomonas_salina.2